jgi:hypothetical protein
MKVSCLRSGCLSSSTPRQGTFPNQRPLQRVVTFSQPTCLGSTPSGASQARGCASRHRRPARQQLVAQQPDDPTRAHFYVAQLETVDGQAWLSLHITQDDAEAKLAEVAAEWGSEGDFDENPSIWAYGTSHLPVHNLCE